MSILSNYGVAVYFDEARRKRLTESAGEVCSVGKIQETTNWRISIWLGQNNKRLTQQETESEQACSIFLEVIAKKFIFTSVGESL